MNWFVRNQGRGQQEKRKRNSTTSCRLRTVQWCMQVYTMNEENVPPCGQQVIFAYIFLKLGIVI